MRHLRAWLRLVGLALAIGSCTVGWLLCRLVTRKGSRRQLAAHYFWTRAWARSIFAVLGIRVRVEGAPPTRPFVLVSNHLSYLDILAYWSCAQAQFLSKAQVAGWPVFGWLARMLGTVFLDRTRRSDLKKASAEAVAHLEAGCGLLFFPEGTSTSGYQVLPFKPGLFQVAIEADLPVHVASIGYATPPGSPAAPEAVCWWGDMDFAPHLYRLLQIPRVEARIRFHPEPVPVHADRKEMARAAHTRCVEVFERVAGSEPFDWSGPGTP